ncbi:hypothetical protein AB0I61_15685 [Polymorphospora rubra]|uniref:hypothetical protein n=1 Tax=Polymorphospora rubra TaxID=338584 RepID=UPI0033F7F8B5
MATGVLFASLSAAVLTGSAAVAGQAGSALRLPPANTVTPTASGPPTTASPDPTGAPSPTVGPPDPTASTSAEPTPTGPSPSGTPTPAPTRSTSPDVVPSASVSPSDGHGGDEPSGISGVTPSNAAWHGAGAGERVSDWSTPAATTPPRVPAAPAAEPPSLRPAAADQRPTDHRHTLVYSGIFGLVIATTGLAMIGWRRQHW